MELHTFSSLDLKFIKQNANSLDPIDEVHIFYDSEKLKIELLFFQRLLNKNLIIIH